MNHAAMKFTGMTLKHLLMIPDAWEITTVSLDFDRDLICLTVIGDTVPNAGELRGEFVQHDDGLCVHWKPQEPPGLATFMQNTDGRCFWCEQPLDSHGPKRICLSPMVWAKPISIEPAARCGAD